MSENIEAIRKRYPAGPEGLAKVGDVIGLLGRIGLNGGVFKAAMQREFGNEVGNVWGSPSFTARAIHAALWPPTPPRKAVADMTLAECVAEGCRILGMDGEISDMPTRPAWWHVSTDNHRAAIVAAELADRLATDVPKYASHTWSFEVWRVHPDNQGDDKIRIFWARAHNPEKRFFGGATTAEAILRAMLEWARKEGETKAESCETCGGAGTVDEGLGGEPWHGLAPCPDCAKPAPVDWAACGIPELIEGAQKRLVWPLNTAGYSSLDFKNQIAILADRLEAKALKGFSFLSVHVLLERFEASFKMDQGGSKIAIGQTPGEARLRALMAAGDSGERPNKAI